MRVHRHLIFSLPLAVATLVAAPGNPDVQDITIDKPVQIPEAVLQPGKYTIRLEDRLSDRAVVRITEPNGAEHYLLSVPSKNLTAANQNLIYFPGSGATQALEGWKCADCKRPLEFVYPKDDAVKLTGETGKPVLAYDASYDKLPSNLSPDDRKVVTLWLLSPKTVTAEGKGEGLTAAKYSSPKTTQVASAQATPNHMPKTATNSFSEMLLGGICIVMAGGLIVKRRWEDTRS